MMSLQQRLGPLPIQGNPVADKVRPIERNYTGMQHHTKRQDIGKEKLLFDSESFQTSYFKIVCESAVPPMTSDY